MWKCHKCGKPVYFAERKQSLGYDWHPECLRCEECGKRLNPGQHAEHKGVPYCHVPCYGALFGPQLFGHGTRVESHKSFGQKGIPKATPGAVLPRSHLESKLKVFNQFYDGRSGEIRSREVNGRLVLEGALRIYWGVQGVIHLKEDDDQRTVVTIRKRYSCRYTNGVDLDSLELVDNDIDDLDSTKNKPIDDNSSSDNDNNAVAKLHVDDDDDIKHQDETDDAESKVDISNYSNLDKCPRSVTLPPKLNLKTMEWDELDDLLQVERKVDETEKLYQTMPTPLPSQGSQMSSSQSLSSTTTPTSPTLTMGSSMTSMTLTCSQLSTPETEKNSSILDLNDTEVSASETTSNIMTTSIDSTNTETTETNDSEWSTLNDDDTSWSEHSNHLNRSMSGPDCLERIRDPNSPEFDDEHISPEYGVVLRRPTKSGSTAIKRRPGKRLSRGTKLKRRCSINGHFYNRETSFFTPPHGSQMSVWVTSLVNTQEVINLMLEKYKVDSHHSNFALFVIRDNGEQKRLKDDEYPLLVRVLLGPHEDVSRLFLMDKHTTPEVSNEVAQFLNLSAVECRAILAQYQTEEEREINRIQDRYSETRRRVKQRMEDLKVRL